MCGILGVYSNNLKLQKENINKLIFQSKIRGLHSFGTSYLLYNNIRTKKTLNYPDDKFLEECFFSKMLIYHNRYSTSGDWKNENNNQPISFDNISIAMNGVISMKTKDEFEKDFNVKCQTENDSEIFLRILQKTFNPVKTLKICNGSIATVFIYNKNIYAIRNKHRPLHCFQFQGTNYVCSTNDIAYRALKIQTIEIEPNKLFNIKNFKYE